ncbi:K02A2.6-like [Cordylochernes scorpioides]|uniref:K02A2.6-like n=1 Tax=Cordylochernes scorpioides TaxID=51811 RepID=A0ABY6LPI7_9ARAC|nr:K02A2.6-like [Cordylochernes scorpioides]
MEIEEFLLFYMVDEVQPTRAHTDGEFKHCHKTSYHSQTKELTGDSSKTLINMLSMFANTNQNNWHEILPFATHAYNTTISFSDS